MLDTNVVADFIRSDERLITRIGKLEQQHSLITCPIIVGETRFGILRMMAGRKRLQIQADAERFFADAECIAIPRDAGEIYAQIKHATQRAGTPMNDNDMWIAATALAVNATLVTRDRDFQAVPDLRVEDWSV